MSLAAPPSREQLRLRTDAGPDVVRIGLSGALDSAGAELLEHECEQALEGYSQPLLLDLGGVSFVDSGGLRAVLRLYGRCLKLQRELRIVPAPEHVQRVFALTRAADVLPFEEQPDRMLG